MRPISAPPWLSSQSENSYYGNRWDSRSQQERRNHRIQSAVTSRHEYKTSENMASTGILVQSRVGNSVISDRLSTKSAVRGVIAANIREKGRLFYLNRSYDRGTWNSQVDMNHQQTLAKLHMSKLLIRASEEKIRRHKEQEKIQKAIEEREKKKAKAKTKTAFAFGKVKPTAQSRESNMTAISMDELKDIIDELEDSDDDLEKPPPAFKKSNLKTAAEKGATKPLTPLEEIDEDDAETNDWSNAGATGGAPRGPTCPSGASRSVVKSNKPLLKSKPSGLQRPGLTKHRTTLTPEAVQALAVKLGATDGKEDLDPSASAGRILQVIRENEEGEEKNNTRFRKLTRLLSRANLVSEAALSSLPRNTKRSATNMSDKFLEKYYHMAKGLPPVYATEPGGFQEREWESKDNQEAQFLTEEEWQDIKWCRYVRFSKKFHDPKEIVALDLNV